MCMFDTISSLFKPWCSIANTSSGMECYPVFIIHVYELQLHQAIRATQSSDELTMQVPSTQTYN